MVSLSDIKLVATDLDGTLLRPGSIVSDHSAEVFHRLRQKGIKTAISTGRSLYHSHDYAEKTGVDGIVVHNGSAVYAGDKLLFHTGIEKRVVESVIRSVLDIDAGMRIAVEIEESVYSNFDTGSFWPERPFIDTDFTLLPGDIMEKIVIDLTSVKDSSFLEKILPPELYIENVESKVCIILSRLASKGGGVKILADYFGVNMSEVAAFGNFSNDISMIKDCGVGIAMSNAIDEVKSCADYICGSNADDGVAAFIEENILRN